MVFENPNVGWETHIDEDGVERTYACADVLLFTALYKEAEDIVGKSQSMELYEPSLSYHQEIIEGQKGLFLTKVQGYQGVDVEPCFGSIFHL